MRTWILSVAAAFFCWGVWAFLPKLTVRYIDPRSAVIFGALGGLLVAIISAFSLGFRIQTDPRGIGLALLTGVLGVAGAMAFLFAARSGPISIVATVTALYPILTIILAAVFLAEPVTARQWAGMVLGFIAIALIAA